MINQEQAAELKRLIVQMRYIDVKDTLFDYIGSLTQPPAHPVAWIGTRTTDVGMGTPSKDAVLRWDKYDDDDTPLYEHPSAQPPAQAEPIVWECKAGGLKKLTQAQYEAQPDNIKLHYTRIESQAELTDSELNDAIYSAIASMPMNLAAYPSRLYVARAVIAAHEAKRSKQ